MALRHDAGGPFYALVPTPLRRKQLQVRIRSAGGHADRGLGNAPAHRNPHRREAHPVMFAKDAVRITPYRDGPLLVRGRFELMDSQGNAIETTRAPVALCRCGKSRMRPFCDGTHKLTGFRAPNLSPSLDPPSPQ
jgi:CDGSH-type Zn-finger protein